MKTAVTLFTGGGLADVALEAAGYKVLAGLELESDIAAVANKNLGEHVRVGNILDTDPAGFPDADLYHFSPPCTRASLANAKAGESQLDIDLAHKIAEFIRVKRPESFTLENVRGYQGFKAFRVILNALSKCGYKTSVFVLNSAAYGVPQTRIRLIVMASLSRQPQKPPPTHQKGKQRQRSLFDTRLPRWVGWYEAIADLIPTLPESKFATWQLARLPEEMASGLVSSIDCTFRETTEPANTVVAVGDGHSVAPRAFIVEGSAAGIDNKFNMPVRAEDEPVFTMRAGQNNPRAFIVGDQRSHDGQRAMVRDFDKPVFVTDTRPANKIKAFIVDGQETVPGKDGRAASTGNDNEPYLTVSASVHKVMPKAFIVPGGNANSFSIRSAEEPVRTVGDIDRIGNISRAWLENGRVVKMTPRCLARFQSLPDWYELPDSDALAAKIIGNGFPCLMAQRIFEVL